MNENKLCDIQIQNDIYRSPLSALNNLPSRGEMASLIRQHDWTSSKLGPPEGWSSSLLAAVNLLLSSSFPMIIFWGHDLNVIYNDAYIPIFGARHPTGLGKPFIEAWGEVWDSLRPMLNKVMYEGEATWFEDQLLILTRNNYVEECYMTWSYSPIRNQHGEVEGVLTPITETTKRVLGERRLRVLRELGSKTGNVKDVIETCNISAETLLSNPADIPFGCLYLSDSKAEKLVLQKTVGLEKNNVNLPAECLLKDNFEEGALPKLLQKTLTDYMVEIDTLNDYMPSLTGVGVWPEPPHKGVMIALASSKQDKPSGVLFVGINSRRKFDEDYIGFLEMAAGQISKAIATAKAYEEERHRSEALAALDHAKTVFFSNISHEFRTPLTLMLSPIEDSLIDQEEPLSHKQRERQLLIYRNANRLLKLVNSLLDFSRIEAGRSKAIYTPTDLEALTKDAASMFRSLIEKAGLTFVVETTSIEELVYIDQEMWEKIVLNLLSNAFKFTFSGKIILSLRKENGEAIFKITDTGEGIPSEELPHLFERFHRIEKTKGRSYEGSGIGLALVQELVKLHGGRIEVESKLKEGTTFKIYIPLGKSHLPQNQINEGVPTSPQLRLNRTKLYVEEALSWLQEENEQVKEIAHPPSPKTVPAARILIADDNPDMRSYLIGLLNHQWTVETAVNGNEALSLALKNPPDLILSDVMMPGMDGFELIQQLKRHPQTMLIPVVLLSARAGEESRVEGLKKGADDYLVKPFSARELITRVETHLKLGHLRKKLQESISEKAKKLEETNKALNQEIQEKTSVEKALSESEARYRNLMKISPVGIAEMDSKGVCHYANTALLSLFNLDFQNYQQGKWISCLDDNSRENFSKQFQDYIKSHTVNEAGEAFQYTFRINHTNGYMKWIYMQMLPDYNSEHQVKNYIATYTDITLQKKLEEEHMASLTKAEEVQRLRAEEAENFRRKQTEFIDNICHELRNPANGINGSVEMLKDVMMHFDELSVEKKQNVREDINKIADEIQECVNHQMVIIDDVLSLSKLEVDKVELNPQVFDLKTTLLSVIKMFKNECRRKNLTLKCEFLDEMLIIKADQIRMKQVIINLVSNAIKFTEKGGVIIKVNVKEKLSKGDFLEICVVDTGIGISENDKSKLFNRYTQASNMVHHRYGGSGLGLAISKKLAELMEGDIEVESEWGVGSIFKFSLTCFPLTQAEKNEFAERSISRKPGFFSETSSSSGNAAPQKILTVDDNIINQKVLGFILSQNGYAYEIANNGEEAVKLFSKNKYSLIFMDIQMPVMNGYDATKRIREKEKELNLAETPIICLSGNVREEYKQKALDVGMNAFITKPFKKEIVLKKIRKFLENEGFPQDKKFISKTKTMFPSSVVSVSSSETTQVPFDRVAYAKILIENFIPSKVSVEKTDKNHAIEKLVKALDAAKIDGALPEQTRKLIEYLFRGSLYKTFASFFCCGNSRHIRLKSKGNLPAFSKKFLTAILVGGVMLSKGVHQPLSQEVSNRNKIAVE